MQQLIDDLKSIPGVIGAYVYHPNGGLRANNLPPLFKNERITETAKSMVKITAAGRHNFHDLSDIFLSFEESSILCRQLAGSNFVIAVCDPDINFNVLSMSLNLVMEEVNSRIVAQQFAMPEKPAATAPTAPEPKASAAQPDPVYQYRGTYYTNPQPDEPPPVNAPAAPPAGATPAPALPMAPLLEGLAHVLTKFLGPMAKIVLDDAVENWSQGRTPSANELPALIDTLCREIDDPDKEKSFRQMVRTQLSLSGQ
jgi:predicted regulator of Ras-like GTPase activity (Roadblock/LC7/MglB family)